MGKEGETPEKAVPADGGEGDTESRGKQGTSADAQPSKQKDAPPAKAKDGQPTKPNNAQNDKPEKAKAAKAKKQPKPELECLSDRAIDERKLDAFGHRHFARALATILHNKENRPPFSVGLLGGWGSGKSSIRKLYKQIISDSSDAELRNRIVSVEFNAWRHGGENMRRALLREIFLSLGGDETVLQDSLYRTISQAVEKQRTIGQILKDLGLRLVWPVVQIAIVALFGIGAFTLAHKYGVDDEWLAAAGVASLGIATALVKYVFDPKRLIAPHFSTVTRVDAPHTTAEQYEDLLLKQLGELKAGKVKGRAGKKAERLVVFVDDLDRLLPRETLAGLEAIRTFMELPEERLPEGLGVVFVVSCDEGKIAESLAASHENAPGLGLQSRNDARRYLDRVFQYRLEIPPLAKQDMRSYALRRMRAEMPKLTADIEARTSMQRLIERLIHVAVTNPRSAIQHVNAFSQAWWVARVREAEGVGHGGTGVLSEGAITEHPLSLAALCALRVSFPDFYSDLEKEPGLLHAYLDVFLRKLPFAELPERTRTRLSAHAVGEDDERRPRDRELRRFIMSLQGLTWPRSLKHFLLLSQDAVSRKFGDRAEPIRDALVSGDHAGILEALGRELDGRELTDEAASLLSGLLEDLHGDSPERIDNAHAAIAALADRLPGTVARPLIVSILRRFVRSSSFRHRMPLAVLTSLMERVGASERVAVANQLVHSFIEKQPLEIRLPTGEWPSLDEGRQMVLDACGLIIDTWKRDGLSDRARQIFIGWLGDRTIRLGDEQFGFGYSQLEEWVGQYPEGILTAWRGGYCRVVVEAFSAPAHDGLDVSQALPRLKQVLEDLRVAGEESREARWSVLTELVGLREEPFVKLAVSELGQHLSEPPARAFSAFLGALTSRLQKDMDDADEWQLESWEAQAQELLNAIEKRSRDVRGNVVEALAKLADTWVGDEVTKLVAIRLATWVLAQKPDVFAPIVKKWVSNVRTELPIECVRWLGASYSQLSKENKTALFAQFQGQLQADQVPEDTAARFREVVASIPGSEFSDAPANQIVTYLVKRLPQMISKPPYLAAVFPAVPAVVAHGRNPDLLDMVIALLNNATSQPQQFALIHGGMAQVWPAEDSGEFTANTVFTQAREFVNPRPQTKEAATVFESMKALVDRSGTAPGFQHELAQVAATVYLHHPEVAEPVLVDTKYGQLVSSDVARLTQRVSAAESEGAASLGRVWAAQVPGLDAADVGDVMLGILAEAPAASEGSGDRFLETLFTNIEAERLGEILDGVVSQELSDAQSRRLVHRTVEHARRVGSKTVVAIVGATLAQGENKTAIDALLEDDTRRECSGVLESQEQRNQLGRKLAISIARAESRDVQQRLAGWINELQASAVVREPVVRDALSEEELEQLDAQFPTKQGLLSRFRKRDD